MLPRKAHRRTAPLQLHPQAVSWSLLRLLVRIDHLARLVLRRRYHDLGRHVPELADVIALDVLELHLQHARLRPFALRPKRYVADQSLERGFTDVIRQLVVVEGLGGRDRLLQHLKLGVAPGRDVVAQRVDTFRRRPRLIPLHELCHTGVTHLVDRQPEIVVDESVPLSGGQEVPAVFPAGAGMADVTYDPQTRVVTWSISYRGLSGPVTMAHFHGPASPGKNAGPVVPLSKQG